MVCCPVSYTEQQAILDKQTDPKWTKFDASWCFESIGLYILRYSVWFIVGHYNFMNSWYEFQLYDFDIYCDGDIVSL